MFRGSHTIMNNFIIPFHGLNELEVKSFEHLCAAAAPGGSIKIRNAFRMKSEMTIHR